MLIPHIMFCLFVWPTKNKAVTMIVDWNVTVVPSPWQVSYIHIIVNRQHFILVTRLPEFCYSAVAKSTFHEVTVNFTFDLWPPTSRQFIPESVQISRNSFKVFTRIGCMYRWCTSGNIMPLSPGRRHKKEIPAYIRYYLRNTHYY